MPLGSVAVGPVPVDSVPVDSVWFASTDDTPDDAEHAASAVDTTNNGASTATLETRLTIGRYCPVRSPPPRHVAMSAQAG